MVEGPLGGPRPLVDDKRTVLVLIGVDGPSPPNEVQMSTEETINSNVNQAIRSGGVNIDVNRDTVNLVVEQNPSSEQIQALGDKTLHVQQYGVKTELEEIPQGLINAVHNTVVEEVRSLGFNVVGTKTTVA